MAKGSEYNARARRWLEDHGYGLIAKVEWFNDHTKRMHDLFGVFDFLAVGRGHTVGVQVTSRSNASNRRTKVVQSGAAQECAANGWKILLLSFDQPKGKGTAWRAHPEWLLDDDVQRD